MPDHIHILFGLNPKQSISDLVADIKRSSSLFINEQKFFPGKFLWQDGYGAFSYSGSQLDKVYKYIENQQIHHNKVKFKEEYLSFLKESEIEFNDEYLFEFF
jgi:REP element-mobilizing transposase RayT